MVRVRILPAIVIIFAVASFIFIHTFAPESFTFSAPFFRIGYYSNFTHGSYYGRPVNVRVEDPVLILAWTKIFGKRWNKWLGRVFDGCPSALNCELKYDRSLINESAAILFHIRDIHWSDLPPKSTRRSNQYYVFALWESPLLTWRDIWRKGRHDFFNLTMTYRRDADVFIPYGIFQFRTSPQQRPSLLSDEELVRSIRGKKKLIAWFVSNCNVRNGRKELVRKLQRYVPVDIYGKCGNLTCKDKKLGRSTGLQGATACHPMLTRDYKFYLSFENSLCRDYVTEKFYSILAYAIVVPIVMETKIIIDTVEDNEIAYVLNKSFIAVDDFESVQELANYLQYLNRNLSAYLQYFQWRINYSIAFDQSACELCRLAKEGKQRVITNISKWWIDESHCHTYKSEHISRHE